MPRVHVGACPSAIGSARICGTREPASRLCERCQFRTSDNGVGVCRASAVTGRRGGAPRRRHNRELAGVGAHVGVIVGDVAPSLEFEGEVIGGGAANRELSEMEGLVVEVADGSEVLEVMAAAAALVVDVVEIEADVPAAAGHGATVAIAGEDLLALAGGDRGGGSCGGSGIEGAEVDGIAGGALRDGGIDLDVLAAAVLPGALAVGALLDRELVRG